MKIQNVKYIGDFSFSFQVDKESTEEVKTEKGTMPVCKVRKADYIYISGVRYIIYFKDATTLPFTYHAKMTHAPISGLEFILHEEPKEGVKP